MGRLLRNCYSSECSACIWTLHLIRLFPAKHGRLGEEKAAEPAVRQSCLGSPVANKIETYRENSEESDLAPSSSRDWKNWSVFLVLWYCNFFLVVKNIRLCHSQKSPYISHLPMAFMFPFWFLSFVSSVSEGEHLTFSCLRAICWILQDSFIRNL